MTFDDCLEFLNNHQEELPSEMPYLGIFVSGHREGAEEEE